MAIRSLLIDGNKLWLSSEGEIGSLDLPLTSDSRYQPLDVEGLADAGEIWDLRKTGDGTLVAVTPQDVWIISPDGRRATRTHLPNQDRLMTQDWPDRVLIAQIGEGLWEVADGRVKQLENPLPDPSDTSWHGSDGTYVLTSRALYVRDSAGWKKLASTDSLPGQALITSVARWENRVVATTYAHGLALFDLTTGKMQLSARAVGLDRAALFSSFVDRNGRLWVGRKKGITVFESLRYGHSLATSQLPVLVGRGAGSLLLGYDDHAELWFDDGRSVRIPERPWSFRPTRSGPLLGLWGRIWVGGQYIETPGNKVSPSVELPDGDLIVASGDRLYRVNPTRGTADAIAKPATSFSGLAVSGDSLWAAGTDGRLYRSALGPRLAFENAATFGHRWEPTISDFEGDLILTSTNGVLYGPQFLLIQHTERLRQVLITKNADGHWLVGEQDGARRLGKLVKDNDRVIWETVEAKGLAHLSEIDSAYGDGHTLTLCGDSRVIELKTDQLQPHYRLSPPRLQFTFHNRRLNADITQSAPPAELAVNHGGLSFRGMIPLDEFGEPPRFERRLRPSETAWQTTLIGETVSYPSLSPQTYTLEVRATHLGRAGEVLSHTFTVLPPWYATRWAAAAYLALAAGAFYGLYRLRTHTLRRRAVELQRIVDERTRDLAKASAAKTDFLASMSHEIRNPLNGVVGLINKLREQPDSLRQANTVNLLHKCADQLRMTVDEILDFSKIEAGRIDLERIDFDLRNALESAAASVDPSGDRITFVDPPPWGVQLVGDAGKLRQILANYLNNALKYGVPPGATVTTLITEGKQDVRLTLAVASGGPTIPKDTLDQLFESFARGRAAVERNIRGAGLGLAICRKYAEAMGGGVGAVSANGETTFYVTLPFARANPNARPIAPAETPRPLPARALAIEDEDYNRVVLGHILEKMNYTVDWATTGAEALRLARENGYDVIFTDYRLPDTNGVELTKRILAVCSDPTPAVFAVTAYSTIERRDECLNAGMSGFISKPITLEKLRSALAAWAEHRLATMSIIETASPTPLVPPISTPDSELLAAWEELQKLASQDPQRAAAAAHRLNNLCRARGLTDAAEQLELAEGALERGEPVELFLRACEAFLPDYCKRATVVNPLFNA